MYRSCMFCSAPLGSNESLERFPVGRSVAFDGAKGRLWAVCPRCARWNLAPLEERWEAIEDAERLFRDTRLRVQRENIGMAKLRDGTRLVRVGQALPGELAAWRYGETLFRRRRRYLLVGGAVATVGVGAVVGAVGAGISMVFGSTIYHAVDHLWRKSEERRVVQRLRPGPEVESRVPVTVRRRDLPGARLLQTQDGRLGLWLPEVWDRWEEWEPFQGGMVARRREAQLLVTGQTAHTLLARAMAHVNRQGARRDAVDAALGRITATGSPRDFLRHSAQREHTLVPFDPAQTEPVGNLALEMAVHDETERRALDGELAMLEAMWREAEEIAGIADRLPDLPAPEPPALPTAG